MAQLEGVRVVDLTTYIAAPSAGRALASMGAEVIKVEPPRGDGFKPFSMSCNYPAYPEDDYYTGYDVMNFLKKGLCLNLKDPALKAFKPFHSGCPDKHPRAGSEEDGSRFETLKSSSDPCLHPWIWRKTAGKDKPGFDYTAYFSRGGVAYSVMEKGTSPAVPVSVSATTMVLL